MNAERSSRPAAILAALGLALAGTMLCPSDAGACGMFVPSIGDLMKSMPKLAVEQVLIIHDAKTKTEHFIREIRVDRAGSDFGFVVPIPYKPEVARVDKEPFKALRDKFPFRDPNVRSLGKGGPPGAASNDSGGGNGVTVLSEQQIGNFKTFVLSATSGGGLQQWLTENHFAAPEIARGWIDHYVKNDFFFVAFRYDAPKNSPPNGITGETVRISFPTPVPYYPYLEPRHRRRSRGPRALAVWYAGSEPMHPIASLTSKSGQSEITGPWMRGATYDKDRAKLEQAIGSGLAKLLPKGKIVVETFQDLRNDRSGYGDVLFAPDTTPRVDDSWKKERAKLLPILDPWLEAGDGHTPVSTMDAFESAEEED